MAFAITSTNRGSSSLAEAWSRKWAQDGPKGCIQTMCKVASTIERHLGRAFDLAALEVEMPSFSGRLRTRQDEFVWYLENERR